MIGEPLLSFSRARDIPDGSFEFRYSNALDNLCFDAYGYDETRTTMIIDRSVAATAGATVCSVDADCASGHACDDAGACRPFTCQEYGTPAGGVGTDFTAVGQLSGNCPCSGGASKTWMRSSGGALRMTSVTDRQGRVTTYNYDPADPHGLLRERCDGDTDGDGDASTCVDGIWTSFSYDDPNWPARVTLERRRSSISPTGYAETEYEYDPVTGRLLTLTRRGYTRDLNDVVSASIDEVTSYIYDSLGRLQELDGPAGERTVYTYWPNDPAYGTARGMLRYQDRYVDATHYLRTTYEDYTPLGQPQIVTSPGSIVRTFTYSYGGMRLDSTTVAGRSTTFAYDGAGRLATITEPTGTRHEYRYDTRGRLERVETYDSPGPGDADRVRYDYDDGGRTTLVLGERVNSAGTVVNTSYTWTATYESHGYLATDQRGGQGAVTYSYDPSAMGYLETLTRGDGNVEDYSNDELGRATLLQRTFAPGVSGAHSLTYQNESGSAIDTGSMLPTQVTDPGGRVRNYVYDDFGHLIRSDSPEWGTMRWYWVNGQLTQERDPNDHHTIYQYDLLNRVTFINRDADHPTLLGQDYQFGYDNGDGWIPCTTTRYSCAHRVGRLAQVGIEYSPGAFWTMYYDYVGDGRVGTEMWPDGGQSIYEYDAQGRMQRMYFPARAGDAVRYEYDSASGDGHDPDEIVRIVHERTGDVVYWARDIDRDALGRPTDLILHDQADIPSPHVSWSTDGHLSCEWVYRRSGSGTDGVIDRCYYHHPDGAVYTHDSLVIGDGERTFFYDGANRLTCATSSFMSPDCSTALLESYTYDTSDNRTQVQSLAGTTGYLLYGNTLYDEYPPGGRTIWYGYQRGDGGPRFYDQEVTTGAPVNRRSYVYDGDGRLSTVTLYRASVAVGAGHEQHTLSIRYDHRSRPLLVTDHNNATGLEERWQYFWDLEDRLANVIHIPNASDLSHYVVDSYVPIDPILVGRNRAEYWGVQYSEQFIYYATSPEGMPVAAYTFDPVSSATSEEWRGQWGPFGTLLSQTGDVNKYGPPFRFRGQIALPHSEATWWNGSTLYTSRGELVLNRWRAYDPRVGQYLQPEPALRRAGTTVHPYAYVINDPVDFVDRTGLWRGVGEDTVTATCTDPNPARIEECRAALGAGTGGTAGGSGASTGGGSAASGWAWGAGGVAFAGGVAGGYFGASAGLRDWFRRPRPQPQPQPRPSGAGPYRQPATCADGAGRNPPPPPPPRGPGDGGPCRSAGDDDGECIYHCPGVGWVWVECLSCPEAIPVGRSFEDYGCQPTAASNVGPTRPAR